MGKVIRRKSIAAKKPVMRKKVARKKKGVWEKTQEDNISVRYRNMDRDAEVDLLKFEDGPVGAKWILSYEEKSKLKSATFHPSKTEGKKAAKKIIRK